MDDDAELLRRYAANREEAAFAEVVRRHVNLVYRAALRQLGGDAHRAQDATQVVFTVLARKAATLARHPSLTGWLYTTTHFTVSDLLRHERRRAARESEAHMIHEISKAETGGADWNRLRPVLDDVMQQLGDRDRAALLARFFEGRTFGEIGGRLALSEDAARMRVERALEKLRALLARRGVSSTSAALGLMLASEAVEAAPMGLAASVTAGALTGGAMAVGGTGWFSLPKAAGVIAVLMLALFMAWRWQAKENATPARPLAAPAGSAGGGGATLARPMAARNLPAKSTTTGVSAERSRAEEFYREGQKHEKAKRYDEAIAMYALAIAADPQFYNAYFSRAGVFSNRMPMDQRDYARAAADYTRCLEIEPRDHGARHNRAGAYRQLREYEKATADYTEIVEGDVDFSNFGPGRDQAVALALTYRGRILQDQRRDYDAAIADYTVALRLAPDEFGRDLSFNRGRAYQAQKRYDLAEVDFTAAYKLEPTYPNLLAAWAWQLATAPDEKYRDGKAALQFALAATEKFKSSVAEHLDVLAAAYAENGRFDEAVATEEKALTLVEAWERKRVPDMQARLALFRGRQPFRER